MTFDDELKEWRTDTKGPHAFLQWKGTNVCADIYCACGCHSHFDGFFMYHIKCPACGQTYRVESHVRLFPCSAEEAGGDDVKVAEE